MKVVMPEIKDNWTKEEKDTFLFELNDIFWVAESAMGLIEERYSENSQRFQEMKTIRDNIVEDLKATIIASKVTSRDVCFHNLDWLWENRDTVSEILPN